MKHYMPDRSHNAIRRVTPMQPLAVDVDQDAEQEVPAVAKLPVVVPQTVMQPKTMTVMVPHKEQRQGSRTVCKTVYNTVNEQYTVMVPHQEQRQGTRTVCKTVYDSRQQTYTVSIPYTEQMTGSRTVCKTVILRSAHLEGNISGFPLAFRGDIRWRGCVGVSGVVDGWERVRC